MIQFKDNDILLENVLNLSDEDKARLLDILQTHGDLFAQLIPGNKLLNYVRSYGKLPENLVYGKTE